MPPHLLRADRFRFEALYSSPLLTFPRRSGMGRKAALMRAPTQAQLPLESSKARPLARHFIAPMPHAAKCHACLVLPPYHSAHAHYRQHFRAPSFRAALDAPRPSQSMPHCHATHARISRACSFQHKFSPHLRALRMLELHCLHFYHFYYQSKTISNTRCLRGLRL